MPIIGGLWVPWFPFAFLQRWPFCWWVAVVLDHHSRAVVHSAVFSKQPTAAETVALFDEAVAMAAAVPRYAVSDRGVQFREAYLAWCEGRGVRPRFGALGQHGSIAVVERFMRTLKDEALRRIVVPFQIDAMRAEVVAYLDWYNGCRPHQALRGATPGEMLSGSLPACNGPRLEPRARWPLARGDPGERRVGELRLVVHRGEGRPHLPVVSLKRAA